MRLNIDNKVITRVKELFVKNVGYEPNNRDLEGDIENIIIESLEPIKTRGEK